MVGSRGTRQSFVHMKLCVKQNNLSFGMVVVLLECI